MDIAQTSPKSVAHTETSKPIRGVSFGTNQPPDAIRQLVRRWLTDEEANKILSRFQKACMTNRQVLWSGIYIHGASIIFAWFVSQGDLVTVLSHPPPLLFHPSGQTFYQLYEEPIIKGKMGNRPVGRIDTAHPVIEVANDFIYQIWPHNNSSLWIKKFGILDIDLPWRKTKLPKCSAQQPGATARPTSPLTSNRAKAIKPSNKSVTDTKNMTVKEGGQKTKKALRAIAKQEKNPAAKELLKHETSRGKQVLGELEGRQSGGKNETMKTRKKKKKQKRKHEVAFQKAQAQINIKQGQKKTVTMVIPKGRKKAAKAGAKVKSVGKNSK
ncbi:uncharacterized protein FOBCDRAFT_254365 [Fusarium oxysporum Fo47]|uniref:uncharacterized protein n=1 Tax=Fusarium oxysporum Fo47 TaxID=660027 RepID=UPI002869E09F|nr:uncharacterized protein FOBCDRAFT_254365 [Fusarium oxysporum Fo47]QKD62382.2 hypothetical protein FOBCDRAFT_254365 [Fusarium oxysporum Fo47]